MYLTALLKSCSNKSRFLTKPIRIMKLISIFLLATCLQVSAETYAQKVSLNESNIPLQKVFEAIRKQTGYQFFYADEVIASAKKVTINVKKASIEEALDICFKDQQLAYTISENTIVVKRKIAVTAVNDPSVVTKTIVSDIEVKGKVTDEKGDALLGVTITEKGTKNSTSTNADGEFSLKTSAANTILLVSSIGYTTQEVNVDGYATIILKAKDVKLNEIVVVGYGTAQRRNLPTSISKVSDKELKDIPITSFQQALQGKVPGLQITSGNGKPGSVPFMRLRGVTSIGLNSEPVYVVDGVIVLSSEGINTSDIQSVEILKDASAQIYGVNAAAGVVLITTKRGKNNSAKLSFNSTYGITQVTKKLEVLGTDDYIKLINASKVNAGAAPLVTNAAQYAGINTNWQNEIYRSAAFRNNELQFSGGGEKSTYFLSGGYQTEEGTINPASFKRYSVRSNQDFTFKSNLKIGSNLGFIRTESADVSDNARVNQGGVILSALSTPPLVNVINPDGTYPGNPFQALDNPVALTKGQLGTTKTTRLLSNIFAELSLPYDIKLRSSFGVDFNHRRNDYYVDPITTGNGRANNGLGNSNNSDELVWILTNTATYKKKIKNHNFDVLLGSESRKSNYSSSYISGRNFSNGVVPTLNAASQNTSFGSFRSKWAIQSFFGRVGYNYAGKYIAQASVRADGTSRFGKDKKYGTFYSVSGAWRISDENFFKQIKFVNDLKVRASYGTTGNTGGLGDFEYLGSYGLGANYPFNNTVQPGSRPDRILNENLGWEETIQSNLGVDFTILKGKVTATFDLFKRKTTDLLFSVSLPSNTGFGSARQNIGSMENKGYEFSVTTQNVQNKLINWSTTIIGSVSKNKVLSLPTNINKSTFGSAGDNNGVFTLQEGEPVSSFYGFTMLGVNPTTGDIDFKDNSKDGVVTADDRLIIGNALPKFFGSVSNTIAIKGFDLNFLFDGVFGNKIFNANRLELEGMNDSKNALTTTLTRWTAPGQITNMPRAVFGDPNQNNRNSTRWIEDGSFVKLRNVTLGYTFSNLSKKLPFLEGARIYVSGRNLVTFTNYTGYDPEIGRNAGSNTEAGVDYGTYPQTKTYVLGINLNF
jgi:TonB-dependent starch-binding outer membrane protein SusC